MSESDNSRPAAEWGVSGQLPPAWPPARYFNPGTAEATEVMRELEFLDRKNWYELYRRSADGSHWRIDAEDKFQQRYLIRIHDVGRWDSFDASALEKGLLLQRRGGLGAEKCICAGCTAQVLIGSAFCLDHTHERGVRV